MTTYRQIKDLPEQTTAASTDKVALQTASDVTKYTQLKNLDRVGYRDLHPIEGFHKGGANVPTLTLFKGNYYMEAFSGSTNQSITFRYHLPHDYVPNSDLYVHVHWAVNAASPTGYVTWQAIMSYARSMELGSFSSDYTATLPNDTVSAQYTHHLVESSAITAANLGGVTLLPDGILLLELKRLASTDTNTDDAFLLSCDIHYQSYFGGTVERLDSVSGFSKV